MKLRLFISFVAIVVGFVFTTMCSTSACAQWVQTSSAPDGASNFVTQGTTVFCSYDGWPGSIYKSLDSGRTWFKSDTGLNGAAVFSLGMKDSILLAGTSFHGILRSVDSGKTWKPVDSLVGSFSEINSFASHGKYIFAGVVRDLQGQVLRSSDGGRRWQETTTTVPLGVEIYSIVISDSFVVASDWGTNMIRTSNDGTTWEQVTDLTFVTTLLAKDSFIFAGTRDGLWRLTNNQNTSYSWVQIGAGLPSGDTMGTIGSIVGNGKNLFLCMSRPSASIFQSTDMGLTWRKINEGISLYPDFKSLKVFGNYLLAGADGQGPLWRRRLSDFAGVRSLKGREESGIAISPNPTTGMIRINNAPANMFAVSVMNVLGETLLKLSNPISSNLTLDLTHLPRGTYFVRLESAEGVVMKKVVKE